MKKYRLAAPEICAPEQRSFWLQDAGGSVATQALVGNEETDVAIVGGGFCGLWTALRLRERDRNLKITILEADFCGSGASGRNGGQVHSWFAEIDLLEKLVGPEEARSLCNASVDAIDELAELQMSGRIDMKLRLDGWYWTASSKAQEGAWQNAEGLCAAQGIKPFETCDAATLHKETGSSASYQGIVEKHAGTVQPACLALGLRDLALSQGISIHEASPVLSLLQGETWQLSCPQGQVQAKKVVICNNAWASAIPELRRYLYVVASQVIATEPAADILDRLGWKDGKAICDSQANVLYYQRTQEGRVIFGRGSGEVAYKGLMGPEFNQSPNHGSDNKKELRRVYPELANLSVTHDWAGPVDCMVEHLPVFGEMEDAPGLFYGVGFNGTGIAQTPVAGHILASLVLGADDKWSRSGLVGLTRRTALPPEPLRYLGARVVRHAICKRNDLEIQNKKVGWINRKISELAPSA
ncbi:NAD(P)/FAD-dependent oxidoreductase [Celeribacter neptunius]|uniref:Glycine/D-amino acid oxidase n=1 Tax=Celeribacter neptunius TaxID=588602 RepID=A0A1I3TXE2_9RHOB|nr:FAD-binding oxidoreductase [Celeribacter neptunius]SFJ74197.1 Glycine/D-amino acid oxidase [Celeribacter neptunius]